MQTSGYKEFSEMHAKVTLILYLNGAAAEKLRRKQDIAQEPASLIVSERRTNQSNIANEQRTQPCQTTYS